MLTLFVRRRMWSSWWMPAALGGVALLVGVATLQPCHAHGPATTRQPLPPAVTPVDTAELTWNYDAVAPEQFVVRRRLGQGAWQDVATLPGARGTQITWTDTLLSVPAARKRAAPVVVEYVVHAVQGGLRSKASNAVVTTVGGAPRLPSTQVKVVGADSAHTLAPAHPAALAGDGLPTTFWHTNWDGTPTPLPHWIVLDLGAVLPVDGLAYLPRQDGPSNGRIGKYAVAVSQNGSTWTAPVASGTWTWGTQAMEQYARWPAVSARYVRLTALSEAGGGPWTSAAEIGVYAGAAGTQTVPPVALGTCSLTRPTAKQAVITCTQP